MFAEERDRLLERFFLVFAGATAFERAEVGYFMQRPGHMVDKAVLAEAVWGDYADDADNFQFVYAQIKNLRRKLSEAGATIEITSVYGFGYKLVIKQDAA